MYFNLFYPGWCTERRCVRTCIGGSSKQLKMQIMVCHWPSRVHTEHTVSHFCSKSSPSLHPWGYFLSQEETGSSSMQMTVAAAPSQACSHCLINHWKEGICTKKEESKSKSLLSTSCCLRCFCQTWQNAGLVGLGTGKVSLSPSPFFFLPLPLWTEARVLLGLLHCAGGKLPIRATLIEHWKQEFYKGADLLFITSHSLVFFLPHSSVFHWLTLPHSNFLSWSFLQLSLYCVHPFLLCWSLPPLETPMVRVGYNVAFSVFRALCVCVCEITVG